MRGCGAWVLFGVLFGVLTACRTAGPPSPPPSGVAKTSASAGAATPAPSALGTLPSASPPAELARACDSATDCEVAWLLLDCCGSVQAVGVSKGTRDVAEQAARSAHAGGLCECLAEPPRLDSGQTADAPGDVDVACVARLCVTRLAEKTESTPATRSQEPPADAPVRCRSTDDCWVSPGFPERPIARPKGIHHRFRGCVDGEVPPLCERGVCTLGFRYRC